MVKINSTLLDQIKALQTQLASLTTPTPNNKQGNGGGDGGGSGNGGGSGTRRINNDESYYHTHGRTRNPTHTSVSCVRKATDHKDTTTLHNQLGGSTRWCDAQT